jgi:glutamine synthetase
MSTPKSVIEMAKKAGAKMVDVKFVDTFGTWQHFSVPFGELTEEVFAEGFGFDGSSIRGWKSIESSDMLAMPDPETAIMDPFCAAPTLSVTCTIAETGTKEPYGRDPRGIAQKGEKYLASTGLADAAVFGPEAEFFIFDNVQYDCRSNGSFYSVESEEAVWNTGATRCRTWATRSATRKAISRWRRPTPSRTSGPRWCLEMERCGIHVERQHHEVATAGQAEIDFRFDTLVQDGGQHDALQVHHQEHCAEAWQDRDVHAEAIVWRQRLGDAHAHEPVEEGQAFVCGQRICRAEQDGLARDWRDSEARQGALRICNPTTNSYKRLVPGYEAPVNLAYSARNRSAAIRIPTFSESPKAKRIEYRPPDPSANPYLAYTALMMAALDGILNKLDPGEPMDKNLYELPPEELAKVPQVPGSLVEAVEALEKDHEFLLKGDVFTSDFLEMWISTKRKEADGIRLRPHPYEFFLLLRNRRGAGYDVNGRRSRAVERAARVEEQFNGVVAWLAVDVHGSGEVRGVGIFEPVVVGEPRVFVGDGDEIAGTRVLQAGLG